MDIIDKLPQLTDAALIIHIQRYKSYYYEIRDLLPNKINDEIISKLLDFGSKAFAARDELFYRYYDVAVSSITRDFTGKIDEDDIISEAALKLQYIIEHFLPENYTSVEEFTNYISKTIRNHTLRYIQNQSQPISFPEAWLTYKRRIKKFTNDYINTYHKDPDIKEIAAACNLSEKMVRNVMDFENFAHDYQVMEESHRAIKDPERQMIQDLVDQCIEETIDGLDPRKKEIYQACLSDLSRKEIAEKYEISQQRISQIYGEVQNKIRKNLQENSLLTGVKENIKRIKKAVIDHTT